MAQAPNPQAPVPPAPAPLPLLQWQIDANTMGLNQGERVLHRLLCHVHNFTRGQYETLREEGYGTFADLVNWKHKEISKLLQSLSNRPANRGGMRYGDKRVRQIQAITWYVTEASQRGINLDMTEYEVNPDTYMQNAALSAAYEASDDNKGDKPKQFEYKNWISWEESIETYLESIKSACGAPLSYVIRKVFPVGTIWENLDATQQRVHNSQLNGLAFEIDSKSVLTTIKETCLNTDAEVWIKNIKCGRAAMLALWNHYDGHDEAKKRTLEAKQKLSTCFYKHEFTFSFENFISVLQGCFKTLERYDKVMYELDMVENLFEKCQNNHPDFKQEVIICRSQHNTFIGAITYLKVVIARLFPSSGGKKQDKRNVGAISSNIINGVDMSDITKFYSKFEVKKITSTEDGRRAWKQFLSNPERKRAAQAASRKRKTDQRNIKATAKISKAAESTKDSNGDSDELSTAQRRIIAAIINGVSNASRFNNTEIQFPTNGRSVQSAQRGTGGSSGSVTASVVTSDHMGNPL